jgi:hypothetical protein
MTDWEAERVERTARRSSAIPHGGSPLMPSHSQGAERRPERRAGRAGSRWLLRALVVGGLAGVTWLLTGSAAHAADQSGDVATAAGYEPEAESAAELAVDELLEAAAQPPEVVTSIPVVNDALPRPAARSPRASGETAAAEPGAARTAETTNKKHPRIHRAKAHPRPQVNRHIPAARPAPETLHRDLPGDDGPAPRRMNPGAASGIPTCVSGASPEVGPMAVLPARDARGAVDDHRLPVAADIEARRNDAVAPTVSPD